MPASGMPTTRPAIFPAWQIWGRKRAQTCEISTLLSDAVSQRPTDATMSGSACEAST
ncbi:hypothetical protein D3C71_1968490 [compost metagenome]